MNMKLKERLAGLGLIGWIVSILALLIGLIVIAFILCEANKAYWDYRVTKMCEKDGEVIVYEKLKITQEEYSKLPKVNGIATAPASDHDNQPVYSKSTMKILHKQNPKVWSDEVNVIKKQDGKIIASYKMFSRVGGDFPTIIGHPSYFGCPDASNIITELHKIFVIEGEQYD